MAIAPTSVMMSEITVEKIGTAEEKAFLDSGACSGRRGLFVFHSAPLFGLAGIGACADGLIRQLRILNGAC